MKLHQNSFINYINKHNTLFRISDIRNYRLMCKIIDFKSSLSELDFGHYTNFKITSKELQKYFYYNRLLPILKNEKDFVNNKLNCTFTEITPQGTPIFKNSKSNLETKDFNSKLKSLLVLKKAFVNKKIVNGRIVKKVTGGFIVAVLGFFAFLPYSQYSLKTQKKRIKMDLKKKLFYSVIPLIILSIKCLKFKPKVLSKTGINYELNIVVSFRKGIKNFEKFNRKVTIKKLIRISRIAKLKNLNKLNKNKLKKSYILLKYIFYKSI